LTICAITVNQLICMVCYLAIMCVQNGFAKIRIMETTKQ
jgi:hypothetical protein